MRSTILSACLVLMFLAARLGVSLPQDQGDKGQTENKGTSTQSPDEGSKAQSKSQNTTPPSLGELARRMKSDDSKKSQKPTKVYGNDDLPEPDRPAEQKVDAKSVKTPGLPSAPAPRNPADLHNQTPGPHEAPAPPSETKQRKVSSLSPAAIPNWVTYYPASDDAIDAAADLANRVLAPDYQGNDHLFVKGRIARGPLDQNQGPIMMQEFPIEQKVLSVESELRTALRNDGGFSLRALSSAELGMLSARCPKGIYAPVFVVEGKANEFILMFGMGHVIGLYEIRGLDDGPLPKLPYALRPH